MKEAIQAFVFTLIFILGVLAASAQFPIKIPKIPKVEKPSSTEKSKTEQPKADDSGSMVATPTGRPASVTGSNTPTIIKDTVQMTAFTVGSYRGNSDVWSWVLSAEFGVNGPIASGDQLYVEYAVPGGTPIKFDCRTEERQAGYWWKTDCGGAKIPNESGSTYTGPVGFAIRLRNELVGTDITLFGGKMKIERSPSNLTGPKYAKSFVYFVDHDWNLPIGYVFLVPDELRGWEKPRLDVAFWTRGRYQGNFDPHLFYQGKEVGKMYLDGREVSKPVCDPEVDNGTTHYVADSMPQKAIWVRVKCSFFSVQGWDKTGAAPGVLGKPYQLIENPGEYEFKVLWNNRLARSIKFTVKPDGTFDNGMAAANKLGRNRVVVPVQIIGDQDGTWNRTAWKTEAFYGNPLAGFIATP